jgi:hypothetical protein
MSFFQIQFSLTRSRSYEFFRAGFVAHNVAMPICEALRSVRLPAALILCVSLLLTPSMARARNASGLDAGYISALADADHLLQAWQSGDSENGIALLASRAKASATADTIDKFFSNSTPSAYEIGRGKLLKPRPVRVPGCAGQYFQKQSPAPEILQHRYRAQWRE